MGWRIVHIGESERMSLHLDSLLIKKGENEYKIPLIDIDTLILEDNKTSITSKLINKITEFKILFIICDNDYNPDSIILPISGHHRQYKSVMSQLDWTFEQKNFVWDLIVKNKIQNQIHILSRFSCNKDKIDILENYIEEIKDGDSFNREGLAAKVYFRDLFGNEFLRGNGDPINSALDYGYTILTSAINRSVCAKGLLPYIGLHHKNEYNHFNLSCDLVEPYRPIVDYWVFSNMQEEKYLTKNNRMQLINLLNAKILFENRNEVLLNSIDKYIDNIINFLTTGELNIDKLPNLKKIILHEL